MSTLHAKKKITARVTNKKSVHINSNQMSSPSPWHQLQQYGWIQNTFQQVQRENSILHERTRGTCILQDRWEKKNLQNSHSLRIIKLEKFTEIFCIADTYNIHVIQNTNFTLSHNFGVHVCSKLTTVRQVCDTVIKVLKWSNAKNQA